MARNPGTSNRTLLTLVVTALLVLSACSGDDFGSASDDSGGSAATTAESAEDGIATGGVDGDEAADDGAGAVTDVGDIDLAAAEIDREIVYRGDISSEVDDVVSAVRSARDEVAAEGGFVFAQEVSGGSARVVLKVPSVRFDAAFDAVAAIGDVTSQSVEAEDVTEQFTDLESRRATLEASIARLRGFLAEATDVDQLSRLEAELTKREAERDVIAGQLRVLEDRTSFATISASFTASDDALVAGTGDEASGPPGFGRGLEVGWDGVVFAAGVTATAGGFIVPFLPLGLVAAGLAWWWHRRRTEVGALADRPS